MIITRARDFVKDLSNRFPTEDKGELSWILNVEITRDRINRSISMSQRLYVHDLLTKHEHFISPSLSKQYDTPAEEGLMLEASDQPDIPSNQHDDMAPMRATYMSVVGGLLWLANVTRLDLCYITGQLARFMTNPGLTHIKAAKRALLYLRNTAERVLTLKPDVSVHFETFVDSNWCTLFSCSGTICKYHSCVFHWCSKMQRSVSLSSAEAEFFGAMMAARDVMFVREILIDLGVTIDGPSLIYSDSKSAIDMTIDPIAFKKTKHILRAAQFLRDLVAKEIVTFTHMQGSCMPSDLLTKAVSRSILTELMKIIHND